MLRSSTLALLSLSLAATSAQALESPYVGPRALGMGGVGVACADDYVAQFYNPGMFGFFAADGGNSDNNDLQRKDWGMGVDVTAGARLIGNLGKYANDVLGVDVDKLRKLGQGGSADLNTLEDATKVLRSLAEFNEDRDAVLVDANAGGGLRIKHFAIGARVYGNAIGKLKDLDTTHVGIELPGGTSVVDQINNINVTVPSGYSNKVLTSAQVSQLTTSLSAATPSPTSAEVTEAINKIDIALKNAGISGSSVQSVVDQVDKLVAASGTAGLLFSDNTTKLHMVGLAVAEIPITYGVALNEHFAIGGSVKYMLGRVYGQDIDLINDDDKDFGEQLKGIDKDYKQSSAFGVDLGIVARFPLIQLGLTGRNLNGPTFDGPTVNGVKFDKIKIDPQITAGVAFMPLDTVTIAADADLTESTGIEGLTKSQHVGAGAEWNIFHTLALRGGVSKDIAQTDAHLLYSGGVGLNLWLLRLDVAGQFTTDKVVYDGDEYPQEARVSFALATDW